MTRLKQQGATHATKPMDSQTETEHPLPAPGWDRLPGLGPSICERRSQREYGGAMSQEDLSLIIAASYGKVSGQRRAVPSAGGLYPFDLHVLVNHVQGMEPGIYIYRADTHSLALRSAGPWGEELARAALGQRMCRDASVVLALVCVFGRTTRRYGERGYRYVYLDAGHVVQNTYLVATGLQLGCCGIAAFYDDETNRLFAVDGTERAVTYMAAVGRCL